MRFNFLSRLSGLFILATLFLAFNLNTAAQDETKPQENKTQAKDKMTEDQNKFKQTATELTQSLSQKVNLTEDQRKEINDALIGYQKEISSLDPQIEDPARTGKITELHDGIRTDIEGILDDNQMTAYEGFSDQWWRDVQTRIHSATVRDNQKTDEQY